MKQTLSGNDWLVSHFLPGEVSASGDLISKISSGELYGGEFIPATVPGDVQSDAIDAGIIDDIKYGFNARKAEWTYQRDWVYVKRFTPLAHYNGPIRLRFDGVDYAAEVYLDGKWLGDHEIASEPFSFDITDLVRSDRESCLLVIVKHAPDAECQWGYTSKVNNLKPRFAYGWDWCTRLVPLGIWKDVRIEYEDAVVIDDVHVLTDVDYKARSARIYADVTVRYNQPLKEAIIRATLTHPSKKTESVEVSVLGEAAKLEFNIDDADLWYPNGMGDHPLYDLTVSIDGTDSQSNIRVGLRHVEWKRTEGASEDALSYQPYINGRRVYLQGYNFTPVRQLYGRPMREVYKRRIELVKRSGANYLRIWGGGLLEREELYDLCDEKGILLMQELFQSSAASNNHPPKDEKYISMLCRAVKSAVMQKRNHPSLICWCGGNELCYRGEYMNADGKILIDGVEGNEGKAYSVREHRWVPLSPEYPTLSAIEGIVRQYDGTRQWFHTSGSGPVVQNAFIDMVGGNMHDVHGPWDVLVPEEMYEFYNSLDMMFHHEFGTPASARVQSIEAVTPQQYRWPIDASNPMANYHGRMFLGIINPLRQYFGEIDNYHDFALASHFMQWEQTRYSLDAHRSLGNRCAGACLWHLGEAWPNLVDNCVVDAFDQVKPGYYGQACAFKPIHLIARYSSVIHKEHFSASFSVSNFTDKPFMGSIAVEIYSLSGELLFTDRRECAAHTDGISSNAFKISVSDLPDSVFFMRQKLIDANNTVIDSGYSIHSTDDIPYRNLLLQGEVGLDARIDGNSIILTNNGSEVISALTVSTDNEDNAYFDDGCIMLLPGESVTVNMTVYGETPTLYCSGFGVPFTRIT